MTPAPGGSRRALVSQIVGVTAGSLVYLAALFPEGFRPGRTAVAMGYTSNFFDQQARALMRGRLDLPPGSLGIEAFVIDGRTFMYFPPFPAILRIPVLWATDEFDGRLTIVSMLTAWLLFVVASIALWRAARRAILGDRATGRGEAVLTAASLAFVTGGTTMTFNASLPWVYHEVYSWAVALAVAAAYWLTRVCQDPSRRHLIAFAGFTIAAIMTRTPTGLGLVCGGLIVAVAWWARPGDRQWPVRDLLIASVSPLALSVALNLAKFGHPFLFPLQSQVWTTESAQRRAALEANDGTLTGLQFFSTSAVNYLSPTGIRFTDHFPWISLPADPARAVGDAFVDQSYRTGAVTAFMLWGCLMLTVALIGLVVRRHDRAARAFAAPMLGTIAIAAGVMTYGYLAHRYTSDFVPALVVGTAVGTPFTAAWLQPRRSLVRRLVPLIGVAAAVLALAAQSATSQWAWAVTHHGAPLVDYVERQARWSSEAAMDRLVSHGRELPRDGRADELRIVGDCDGLYLGTGDAYEPWVTVQARDRVALVVAGEVTPFLVTDLFEIRTTRAHRVSIQTDGRGRARILARVEGEASLRGHWFSLRPGDRVRVAVRVLPEFGIAQVESTPGGFAGFLPAIEWGADWTAHPGRIRAVPQTDSVARAGLSIRAVRGPAPLLCQRLQTEYR